VACLASFRALFATKERSRELEEARERERDDNKKQPLNLRAIKARARHFQESLFETMKSSDADSPESGMGRPLRLESSDSLQHKDGVARVDSHKMDNIHPLNSHGLTEVPEITAETEKCSLPSATKRTHMDNERYLGNEAKI
jgi:hypothetical protein